MALADIPRHGSTSCVDQGMGRLQGKRPYLQPAWYGGKCHWLQSWATATAHQDPKTPHYTRDHTPEL